jgi:hypothetical protein
MEPEAWPTPQAPARDPLPRVEDLPIAEQGYEQESVKAAFDSFYRHAAQLDAALRTLEAVDSFHRHAAALRSDLRTLRAAGWTQQSWATPRTYGYGMRAEREGIPPAVWRIGGEVALLVAAAVLVGVANLSWWAILLAMAGAFAIVCAIEWLAGREELSFARPPVEAPVHPVVEAQRAEDTDEHDALGWTAFEEAQEPSDAMTIIGSAVREDVEVPRPEEAEPEPEPEAEAAVEATPETPEPAEPEPEPEPEPPPASETKLEEVEPERDGGHWWRRRRKEPDAEEPPASEPPRHVRVLAANEKPAAADPWEEGFDVPVAAEAEEIGEPDEQTEEPAVIEEAVAQEPARRRFRRR